MSKDGSGLRGERGLMVLARHKVKPTLRISAPSGAVTPLDSQADGSISLHETADDSPQPLLPEALPSLFWHSNLPAPSAGLVSRLVTDSIVSSGERLPGERKPKPTKRVEERPVVAKLWARRHGNSSSAQDQPPPNESKDGDELEDLPKTVVSEEEMRKLLGKGIYPVHLDFSGKEYALLNDEFLQSCPDIVKELDISNNRIDHVDHISHLTRLKRLRADHNGLYSISPVNLRSLVLLSLAHNRMELLNRMDHLDSLVNLNLSDNRIAGGFSELSKLKSLQVLNLSRNNISLSVNRFFHKILSHLQQLPKLKYLFFNGNPVQTTIFKYRYFVIAQLPKLQCLDGVAISKEERKKAKKLDKKLWGDRLHFKKNPSLATKKNDTWLEKPTGITEGDPDRMSRISEFRVRDLSLDVKQIIEINPPPASSASSAGLSTPASASGSLSMPMDAVPTDGDQVEKSGGSLRNKLGKSTKRKSWDSSRAVRFIDMGKHGGTTSSDQRKIQRARSQETSPRKIIPPALHQHGRLTLSETDKPARTRAQSDGEEQQQQQAELLAGGHRWRHSVQLDELDKLIEGLSLDTRQRGGRHLVSSLNRTAHKRRSLNLSEAIVHMTDDSIHRRDTEPSIRHTMAHRRSGSLTGSAETEAHADCAAKRKADVETIERMLNDLLSSASAQPASIVDISSSSSVLSTRSNHQDDGEALEIDHEHRSGEMPATALPHSFHPPAEAPCVVEKHITQQQPLPLAAPHASPAASKPLESPGQAAAFVVFVLFLLLLVNRYLI